MRKIYIHFGFPRTGTTTLQNHFFPKHSQISYWGKNLVYGTNRFSDKRFIKDFDEIYEKVLQLNDVSFEQQTNKIAKKLNIKTLGITGNDDSGFKELCDVIIRVPASRPDRIQEMHIAIGQILCEIIETELC